MHFGKKKTLNILGPNQSRKKKDETNRQNIFCLRRCEVKCKLNKAFAEVHVFAGFFYEPEKRG